MATPQNPLDKYTTYTYHFELHSSANTDELMSLSGASDSKTTRAEPNGTLLINSRYDAHQIIDDVSFHYEMPGTNHLAPMMPVGSVDMTITEPGACYFLEKLKANIKMRDASSHSGVNYALKIIFVGRKPDNSVDILDNFKPLVLCLINIDANFDYKGGVYRLKFESMNAALSGGNPNSPIFKALGYVNKNVSITAKTSGEAISDLQSQLNKHYEQTYEHEAVNPGARKIVYKLSLPSEFDGDIKTINPDSRDPSEPAKLQFKSGVPISDMMYQIIRQCKSANELIGKSEKGAHKEFHPGVTLPCILPSVKYSEGQAEIMLEVKTYKGDSSNKFEFDFYFAGAGKNVDILDFDMRFPNAFEFWVATENKYGSIYTTNRNSEIPTLDSEKFAKDHVYQDISKEGKVELVRIEKKVLDNLKKNDIAILPAQPIMESHAYNNTFAADVPAARKAINAQALYTSTPGRTGQFIAKIRGHAGMLDKLNSGPGEDGYGVSNGLWIKINIFDEEGRPFYYKGYYRCLSIMNKFSGGQFIQELGLIECVDGEGAPTE